MLLKDPNVVQGSGLIVATLAAGAGWMFRDVIEGQRTRRTICQAYAALIETHFEELSDWLSDAELQRYERLAPKIVDGTENESVGARTSDPFSSLPDIRNHLHLLSPSTVRYIWKWEARGRDLYQVYDLLGTVRLSSAGVDRLRIYFEWVKKYREEYRDVGYTALKCIATDASGVKVDLRLHEQHNAKWLEQKKGAKA